MSRRTLPVLAGVIVALVGMAAVFVFQGLLGWGVFAVQGGNMERTLPRGSYVTASPGEIRRGAVIVHRSETSPGAPKAHFIRRAIATGGDTVACCGPEGELVVNGKPLDEPYVFENDAREFGPVEVPVNRLFVAGDHRSASRDSRAYVDEASKGTVPEGEVVGVVDGPFGRGEAHAQAVLRFVPHLLALGLAVGFLAALLLRVADRRRYDGDAEQRL